jgi:hypothetical protein
MIAKITTALAVLAAAYTFKNTEWPTGGRETLRTELVTTSTNKEMIVIKADADGGVLNDWSTPHTIELPQDQPACCVCLRAIPGKDHRSIGVACLWCQPCYPDAGTFTIKWTQGDPK